MGVGGWGVGAWVSRGRCTHWSRWRTCKERSRRCRFVRRPARRARRLLSGAAPRPLATRPGHPRGLRGDLHMERRVCSEGPVHACAQRGRRCGPTCKPAHIGPVTHRASGARRRCGVVVLALVVLALVSAPPPPPPLGGRVRMKNDRQRMISIANFAPRRGLHGGLAQLVEREIPNRWNALAERQNLKVRRSIRLFLIQEGSFF